VVAEEYEMRLSEKEFIMAVQKSQRSVASCTELDTDARGSRTIYWHRELPPLDSEAMGEQVVEAASERVPGTLSHRDELWNQCYEDLMAEARIRLEQEIGRLGGKYAHVLSESVDSKHDAVAGEAWLHGRFSYMLYR
jgi:hypothetical protein